MKSKTKKGATERGGAKPPLVHSARPGFDEYFMNIVDDVATRSTCLRRKLGAVIVKDKRIIATGYNGAPRNLPHCLDAGCLRDELKIASGTRHEICRAVHAEQNAVLQCAAYGVPCEGATVYTSSSPCMICAKILVNSGIRRVVYKGNYPDPEALALLKHAKVSVEKFEL